MKKYAVVHMSWGKPYIDQTVKSIEDSLEQNLPHILITEKNADMSEMARKAFDQIIEVDFKMGHINRKAEMWRHLPEEYDAFLFMDADIRILKDVSFGFEKAEIHGLAIAGEMHYSLQDYSGFAKVMREEGVEPAGQFHYNTGFMFFSLKTERMRKLFEQWENLCIKHEEYNNIDQPYFTLAFEQQDYVPYLLSPSFCYRGRGELISGDIYVWHSYEAVPKGLNEYEDVWPLRRVLNQRIEKVEVKEPDFITKQIGKLRFHAEVIKNKLKDKQED